MGSLALIAVAGALAAASPLADPTSVGLSQAASPARWDAVPALDPRRLRFAMGVGMRHVEVHEGGNSVGPTVSTALELTHWEAAAALALLAGIGNQAEDSRNTGIGGAELKLALRFCPLEGPFDVMLEAAGLLAYERAFAWCAAQECGVVPDRIAYGGALGPVLRFRLGRHALLAGFDLVVRGPASPAAVTASPLAFYSWLELGVGGLP